MILNRATKDPDATLDYTVDWSDWLDDGDTITDAAVIVPTGITLESDAFDDTTVTGWISGGTRGNEYSVTFRVTTVGGRIDDRTIVLSVLDR